MPAPRIQGNYDCLQQMTKVFLRHAAMTTDLTFQIERLVDQLQSGAWRGVGAEAFYAEMGELILPAMRKPQDALQFTGEGTSKIHTLLHKVNALNRVRKCIKANEPRRYHLQSCGKVASGYQTG